MELTCRFSFDSAKENREDSRYKERSGIESVDKSWRMYKYVEQVLMLYSTI